MGVFATRSPFRPNPIGLSSVRLIGVEDTDEGKVLVVSGADLLDGTPIYDIKPYLAYTDAHADAIGGFADEVIDYCVEVVWENGSYESIDECDRETVTKLLSHDPHPSYKNDPTKEYGMKYGKYEIFFTVEDGTLTVRKVTR